MNLYKITMSIEITSDLESSPSMGDNIMFPGQITVQIVAIDAAAALEFLSDRVRQISKHIRFFDCPVLIERLSSGHAPDEQGWWFPAQHAGTLKERDNQD